MASASKFLLPAGIERYLGALSKLYAHEGNRTLQEIVVNATTRIEEGWSHDNWNGGIDGHALFLVVPERLYLGIAKKRDEIQTQIRDDINKIHNFQSEFIDSVFIEMEVNDDSNWRQQSGLVLTTKRVVSDDAAKRIWEDGCYRLFLSHKSEAKKDTYELKEQLRQFGISAFVAHADIQPTKAWQDEIENALASMDGFAALMTDKFHESDWTDQEVGYALARGVTIVALRLGRDPYGFIGKFQGVAAEWQNASEELAKVLIRDGRMFDAYVRAIRKCTSWDQGNVLATALAGIERLSDDQVDQIIKAYNETRELWGSWGFNGGRSYQYGPGLVEYLHRLGTRQFRSVQGQGIALK